MEKDKTSVGISKTSRLLINRSYIYDASACNTDTTQTQPH